MMTLIATCYLAAQTLFAVPPEWSVTEMYTGGSRPFSQSLGLVYCDPGCEETRRQAYIRLSRKAALGETVAAPKDCTLQVNMEATP